MRCKQCGNENPESNKFCGNCGARLEPDKVVVAEPVGANGRQAEPALPVSYWEEVIPSSEQEPEREQVVDRRSRPTTISGSSFLGLSEASESRAEVPRGHSEPTTISGPSFLGLTDSSDDQSSYLLDDEQPRRHGGLLVFCVFAIAIFAAIGYVEWRTMQTGRLSIPFISKPASEQQAKTPTPAPAQNPSTDAAKVPATPQSDNAESNTDSLASSDNDNAKNGPVNPVPGAAGAASEQTEKPSTSAGNSGTKANDAAAQGAPEQPSKTGSAAAAASDQQETESAQSRQAKDGDQQRSSDDGDSTENQQAAPAKKAKPSAKATSLEKPLDPRQNRMLLLGERYLYGHGVPRNCNQALVYFKGAAEENNAPAMAHLGAMYASGECVTQNRVTAFNWFARAQNAQPSDPWLQRNMNMLWRDMTPQERTAINK